jgi:N-acetylneuraminic acid mutarotase
MKKYRPNWRIPLFLLIFLISCNGPISSYKYTEAPERNIPMTVESQITKTTTPSLVFNGDWKEAPSMLIPHSAHAVASSANAIYALAGTDEKGQLVLEVEKFDGTQWVMETILPGIGLNAPTASIINDQLYVVGGFVGRSSIPTDEVLVYDLSSSEWSNAANMPSPRGGHAAVVLNGKIHVIGGGNSVSTLADHSQYDPETNTWRELAPLPRSKGSPAAVVVNGLLYAIGGRSGYSDFGDVYIYDPAVDSWSNGPSIEPRGTAGAVFYCDAIYLFGGESQSQKQNLDSVLKLDLKTNTWETLPPMPYPRKFARAVMFNNSVYIVGGSVLTANSHSPKGSASVIQFTPENCP